MSRVIIDSVIEKLAADFRREVSELADNLSVIKASAQWLDEIQTRNDPQEISALADVLEAVESAIRKTEAFRKLSEGLCRGTEAAGALAKGKPVK